jgi:hypothetical protein
MDQPRSQHMNGYARSVLKKIVKTPLNAAGFDLVRKGVRPTGRSQNHAHLESAAGTCRAIGLLAAGHPGWRSLPGPLVERGCQCVSGGPVCGGRAQPVCPGGHRGKRGAPSAFAKDSQRGPGGIAGTSRLQHVERPELRHRRVAPRSCLRAGAPDHSSAGGHPRRHRAAASAQTRIW